MDTIKGKNDDEGHAGTRKFSFSYFYTIYRYFASAAYDAQHHTPLTSDWLSGTRVSHRHTLRASVEWPPVAMKLAELRNAKSVASLVCTRSDLNGCAQCHGNVLSNCQITVYDATVDDNTASWAMLQCARSSPHAKLRKIQS